MIIEDVICPFCGSLCDDLTVEVKDNEIAGIENACKLGYSKIIGYEHDRHERPLKRVGDEFKEISYEEGIEEAAKILYNARRPLLYGWASTSCEAIERGIELAVKIGGIIDQTATVCHGPTVLGTQEVGKPSCTLGEVKNRADLVIYWGCNPFHAHPRHAERYSTFTKGYFADKGRKDRKIVLVDIRKTDTEGICDRFIQIEPGSDYKVLTSLIAIIMGEEESIPEDIGGVKKEELLGLAEEMKHANFGMIFFGMGVTMTGPKYKNIAALERLVRELNRHTKFSLMPMRGHYNVAGAGAVFTWRTGFPYAVDFSRGYSYYNPGETTSNDLLTREEVDAMLVVASDPGAHFVNSSVRRMAKIPLIVMDPHPSATSELADLIIPTAICGVEMDGTAYRMDDVPIRFKKLIDSKFKSDFEIIGDIIEKIDKMEGVKD
ncbi:MAG: formylmethanofuran dehydrogenase subunit B [Candidatus Methanolliviera hydrocarbonicum]|uniref:Formylmethanofuran dehydrogenase subunit B n=1 Tax=Candidatus Methanolliviera hydrocarbonicum TaxID=2491085 RepID=A0A520KVQ2_9EURY|nr:MAG: formylmethanofuran dehydrogenase subunit B [Candidatus Methanolliviera hydrocarbonicum]